jgi:hypothetical protein
MAICGLCCQWRKLPHVVSLRFPRNRSWSTSNVRNSGIKIINFNFKPIQTISFSHVNKQLTTTNVFEPLECQRLLLIYVYTLHVWNTELSYWREMPRLTLPLVKVTCYNRQEWDKVSFDAKYTLFTRLNLTNFGTLDFTLWVYRVGALLVQLFFWWSELYCFHFEQKKTHNLSLLDDVPLVWSWFQSKLKLSTKCLPCLRFVESQSQSPNSIVRQWCFHVSSHRKRYHVLPVQLFHISF